jgi:hypothetical protein
MSTLSIREIANHHLAKTGDLSINSDIYGYIYRDESSRLFGTLQKDLEPADIFPYAGTTAAPTTRSLRRHLETISGRAIDLVIFILERPTIQEFLIGDKTQTQFAIQVARDIFAQYDLGLRRIIWRIIPKDEAIEFLDLKENLLGGQSEFHRLTRTYSGPPGGIDVFMVQSMEDYAGFSPVRGPVDKSGGDSGVAVTLQTGHFWCGHLIAHELCHYLGLRHEKDPRNLMCGDFRNFLKCDCEPRTDSNMLTPDQVEKMLKHPLFSQ